MTPDYEGWLEVAWDEILDGVQRGTGDQKEGDLECGTTI